jgi:hypothetical protein
MTAWLRSFAYPVAAAGGPEDGEDAPEQPVADRRDEFGAQFARQIDLRQRNGRQDTARAQRSGQTGSISSGGA